MEERIPPRRPRKQLNLTKEQLERHARRKFSWNDGDVVAYRDKSDLEEHSKNSGNDLTWY